MGHEFASDAWAKALMEAINNHDGYRQAAAGWEGDFYFVINKSQGFPEDTYVYLDLWHGQCREAMRVTDVAAKEPVFVMSAPSATWQKVLDGQLDPIKGLMSRQLKLKGPMVKILKMPKAAIELVNAAMTVETTWPA
jgi:putative sterol carrier protein